MSFNEWRHRHTAYDRRMSAARTAEQQRQIMEQVALEAMQRAVQMKDAAFAASVMNWAQSKRLVAVN